MARAFTAAIHHLPRFSRILAAIDAAFRYIGINGAGLGGVCGKRRHICGCSNLTGAGQQRRRLPSLSLVYASEKTILAPHEERLRFGTVCHCLDQLRRQFHFPRSGSVPAMRAGITVARAGRGNHAAVRGAMFISGIGIFLRGSVRRTSELAPTVRDRVRGAARSRLSGH